MDCLHTVDKRKWLAELPGGMMYFLGCHLIDLIVRIQGVPETIIPMNTCTGFDDVSCLDFGMAALKYPKGISFANHSLGAVVDELRYFKENKAHKRAVVGTGLGLSIVKGILQMHNARFGVETSEAEENHGSTFWFELPCTDVPAKTE